MKKTIVIAIALCSLLLTSCSKDAEVNAFITEFEATTKEITSKIDANPTAAGVADAQKAFDAKKASLKAKWDAIKDAVGFQVSADTKKKLEDSVTKSMKELVDVSTKNAMKLAQDGDAATKFQALMKDYQTVFSMGK
ncbi:MAG TPA: hypothetical protein PKA82_11900 [Pyrinomonadaceae bacterium]|nr:hypothetical protein [Pyrinomonadaceae bacterium]